MKIKTYKAKATMWLYPGEHANWHFLTVPKGISAELREEFKGLRKGFGSLPVEVTVGKTTWRTSIFPDSKAGAYMLPVKASVRRAEDIYVDEKISFSFKVRSKQHEN